MKNDVQGPQWRFINADGDFRLDEPQRNSHLYFPLMNEAGMKAAITPLLHGTVVVDHDSFLTQPSTVEDLHNSRSSRNFWFFIEGEGPWSAAGSGARQIAERFDDQGDEVTLEAGLLWHKIQRLNGRLGLRAELTNFIPVGEDRVELMRVGLTNIGDEPRTLTPTAAIPIYARSAENFRDHRHVTSLLNRAYCIESGVVVRPTMLFDERGHQPNNRCYAVLGWDEAGNPPQGFFPLTGDFIGEGGNLEWPLNIVQNNEPKEVAGAQMAGYEAMGGLRFPTLELAPGQSHSWVLALVVSDDFEELNGFREKYGSNKRFEEWLEGSRSHWNEKVGRIRIATGDEEHDRWLRWVTLQPILRRQFGNSFLPYHDYGHGGKGWRDLWQDILPELLTEPEPLAGVLQNNIAGVRLDGSNATIIGSSPGEFIADRNEISRVWMDHGLWALIAIDLFIDQTGDLDFLLREAPYFKDRVIKRARAHDPGWEREDGTRLRRTDGVVYQGTVLEHLLVQLLTAFFHVGEHNAIKLEDADWNDGLDMAAEHGESVAFTAAYAGNLGVLADLVEQLGSRGLRRTKVFTELKMLLDRLYSPVDYGSWQAKRGRLQAYLDSIEQGISGEQEAVSLEELASDLRAKSEFLIQHLRENEWIQSEPGLGWFNGYYDNLGAPLEGLHPSGIRMTLTGQVFQIMSGVATDDQLQQVVGSVNRYLFDDRVGGVRLNTNFGDYPLENMGRAFGFAYGHKENGAMFSHMAVMYANALYQRGLTDEGHKVLNSIYKKSVDFSTSRIYPGIPEYFNERGRGMYPYLTGSASWYLLTMVREAFGVQGRMGDLVLRPRLAESQFDRKGRASLLVYFAARRLKICFNNPSMLPFDKYRIGEVVTNGSAISFAPQKEGGVLIKRSLIEALAPEVTHVISVALVPDHQVEGVL